ncbi:MAG: AAA family ATPase [Deltaproteobacteria bacterium]|jgi:hypothetical protein|nr:AAA family ATPase [Deltaproteobacteria bacterium]
MGDSPKPIAIDFHSFPYLIDNNFLYVDKTDIMHRLLTGVDRNIFLIRPWRFGKSLLLSTIKEIFQGEADRFSVLKISGDGLNYGFPKWHVISISMSKFGSDHDFLDRNITRRLNALACRYGINLDADSCSDAISYLIEELYASNRTIPLYTDQYDIFPYCGRYRDSSR